MTAAGAKYRYALLAGMLITAFLLRSCGLSHDIEHGNIYHPDTPKQIYATQIFLQGEHLFRTGNINYDGYPYLNSHLVATLVRAGLPAINGVRRHLGMSQPLPPPGRMELFWIFRLMNALLSTASVAIAYLIARRLFSPDAGLLAAMLATLSPLAVITCHDAMSDTSAIFFALLAVYFALRIEDRSFLRDYIFAAVAVAFAFSAKYHGAIAVLAVAVAHMLRYGCGKALFSRDSLTRMLLFACAGLAGFAIATPAVLIDPDGTIKNILTFLEYTSNFGMRPETEALSLPARWCFGLTHNLPDFFKLLSPTLFALLVPAVILLPLRRRRTLIVLVVPLVYILAALPFKPLTHPQYHGIAVPLLLIMAAGALCDLWQSKRYRFLTRAVATACLLPSLILLAMQTRETNFYYQRPDTRLLADLWIGDNIPDSFQIAAGHYTLTYTPEQVREPQGRIMLSSDFRPHRAPESVIFTNRFDFKDRAFELFRNPVISAYVHDSDLLLARPHNPSYQQIAAASEREVIFANSINLLRTPRIFELDAGQRRQRFLVSEEKPGELMLVCINSDRPNEVEIDAAGKSARLELAPYQSGFVIVDAEKTAIDAQDDRFIYEFGAASKHARCQITLAFTHEQKGVALFQIGEYPKALPYLQQAFEDKASPTLAGMIHLCRAAGGKSLKSDNAKLLATTRTFLETVWDEESILSQYFVSPRYIESLPYYSIDISDLQPAAGEKRLLNSPIIFLPPGAYSLTANASDGISDSADTSCRAIDARTGEELPPGKDGNGFIVPYDTRAVRLLVEQAKAGKKKGTVFEIKPDIAGSMFFMQDTPLRSAAQTVSAPQPARARFEGGMEMVGYRISQVEAAAGGKIHVNTYWHPGMRDDLGSYSLWIHFIDAEGNTVFQGDRPLLHDIGLRPADELISSPYFEIEIPPGITAGKYRILAGLYRPLRMMKIDLDQSDLPSLNDGLILGTLELRKE